VPRFPLTHKAKPPTLDFSKSEFLSNQTRPLANKTWSTTWRGSFKLDAQAEFPHTLPLKKQGLIKQKLVESSQCQYHSKYRERNHSQQCAGKLAGPSRGAPQYHRPGRRLAGARETTVTRVGCIPRIAVINAGGHVVGVSIYRSILRPFSSYQLLPGRCREAGSRRHTEGVQKLNRGLSAGAGIYPGVPALRPLIKAGEYARPV